LTVLFELKKEREMLTEANRLPNPQGICHNGLIRFARQFGVLIGLTASTIVLAACQPAPHPTLTPQIITATARPATVTPAPTALPLHIPISLDTPGRAAIRVVNALSSATGDTQAVPLDVYLDGSPVVIRLAPDLPSTALGFQAGHFQLRVFTSDNRSLKLSQALDLIASQSVVVVLTGSLDKITTTVLINNTDSIAAGQIRLSVAHFLANSPVSVSVAGINGQSTALTTINTPATIATAPLQLLTVQAVKFEQSGHDPQTVSIGTPVERQAYLLIWLPSGAIAAIHDDTPRTAQVRVIDANPLLSAIDLRLSSPGSSGLNPPAKNTLKFGESRPWQAVPTGHYVIGLFDLGAAADARPRFSFETDLLADTTQDLILFGTADKPQLSTVSEDLSPLTADTANKARLTIVNAAPGTRGLFARLSGSVVSGLPPAEYGQPSGPLLLQSGTLSLAFQSQGDTSGTPQAVELKAPFDALPNTAYLYVVTGTESTVPAALFMTTLPAATSSSAPTATVTGTIGLRVRLINALGDGTALDLTLNDKPLFQSVATGSGTTYQSYVAQSSTWVIHAAGQTATLASVDLAPISGGSITLLAVGSGASARLEQSVDILPAGASAASALFDVIHAAASVTAIRVDRPFLLPTALPLPTIELSATSIVNAVTATPIGNQAASTVPGVVRPAPAQPLVGLLGYGELSPILSLPPDTYTIAIHDAASNRLIAQIPATAFTIGKRYDVLLLPVSGNSDVRAVLIVSDVTDSGNP
jgi:hypothetical protein